MRIEWDSKNARQAICESSKPEVVQQQFLYHMQLNESWQEDSEGKTEIDGISGMKRFELVRWYASIRRLEAASTKCQI